MMPAYDRVYLEDFRNNLGYAFDCVTNHCEQSLKDFYELFQASQISEQIEKGNPKYLCGMSGTELVLSVCEKTGFSIKIPEYYEYDRSPEYWTGWILAYYQWQTSLSFKTINKLIPVERIVQMYNPLHEAPEEKFSDTMNELIKTTKKETNLHILRKAAGLTQKELAELSGINLRTLQEYETGRKDINKAAGVVINRLAYVLHCNFYDVMELEG